MDFDISEILNTLSPLTLTTSISLLRTDEPLILKTRLGKNVQTMLDEACVFEVEEGSYNLAPVGFPNDPPSLVNISRKRKRYSLVPPQIYLRDRITASELNKLRLASQNPINMTRQDKGTAYDQTVAIKQTGLRRLIDRRVEWFFAQALNGNIDYVSNEGRPFMFDYNLPEATKFPAADAWDKAGNPPLVARDIFSKMKVSEDGKALDIYVESHPLPVIVSNLGVVKAKVL